MWGWFVIVASGACDREAKICPRYGVDSVFPFVRLDVQSPSIIVLGAEAEKSESFSVVSLGVWDEIGGELELDKLVVREVSIKGVDDPLTVAKRVGIEMLGVGSDLVGLVLGVSRDVEPEAGHTFAEVVGVQSAFDRGDIDFF